MAKDAAKDKDKEKAKPKSDAKPKDAKPKDDAKAKAKDGGKGKEKDKDKDKDKAAAAAAEAPKKVEAPRPPADPRLKVLKKFHGKFLPKGPLRERHKTLMARWNSGEDHGGVTVEELKSLLDDWRASRAKPSKAAKA
jgi:hypothetical protein